MRPVTFISIRGGGAGIPPNKSVDKSSWGGSRYTQGRTAIQRDLGRLEERAKRNLMKFSKDKVLYLRVINSLQWSRLGSNSADSHLGLPVERRLNRVLWQEQKLISLGA